MPALVYVFTTRSMSCLRLHSRASVPSAPRKYLVVTIVEALTDQESGNSAPRCSKTASPVFQLVCTTSRRSHVTSSYGCTPSVLKTRSIVSPVFLGLRCRAGPLTVSVMPTSSPYPWWSVWLCWVHVVGGRVPLGTTGAPGARFPTRAGRSVGQPGTG